MRLPWLVRRQPVDDEPAVNEVPFLAAGDGIVDPLPGLTLVVGSAGSGKTVLLDFLKDVHPDAEVWKPDWALRPEPVVIGNRRSGYSHPLSNNLLCLALLCGPVPRTLLIDEGFGDAPDRIEALADWRRLTEDTGHRIVLVLHLRGDLREDLTRSVLGRIADQVIMFGRRPQYAQFAPVSLQSPDGAITRNAERRGEATIWRPADPEGFVTRRVPYRRQGQGARR